MKKIKGIIAGMMLMMACASVSAQEVQFLSANHCIYRINQTEKYLLLPVQENAELSNVKVIANNNQVKTFNVRLANSRIDYYVPLDLDEFKGLKGLSLDIHVNGSYRNDGELQDFACW